VARLQAAVAESEAKDKAIGRVRLPQQFIGLPSASPKSLKERTFTELTSGQAE
jgi:hypothetical protein